MRRDQIQILTMASYNYFRILINFDFLYDLPGVHKIEFTTDHFYLFSYFALAISINCGPRLIPSQVTIFISSMSCYRGSIITDAEGNPRIDYPIEFDQLLSKIYQL